MRGLLLGVVFFCMLPLIFGRPYLGVLMWYWTAMMNPQKISYGFFSTLQYSLMTAVVTLPAWFLSREPKTPPKDTTAFLLCLLMVWVTITSAFSITPAISVWDRWQLVEKMLLFTVLAYALTNTRERLDQLITVCAVSIGFLGVVGGIFTIAHGGSYRVYGPNDSTIGDNNDFGVALVTIMPLLFYLFQRLPRWYLKWPMLAVIVLNFIATLFTYSRGALVAISLMAAVLWFRARWLHKFTLGILFAILVAGVYEFAPPQWFDRMNTIKTYHEDASAETRLYVWQLSWAMAQKHPVMGAGFRWLYFPTLVNEELAGSGLPPLMQARAAHSIWFEMLGDHGFVGLSIFLGLVATGLVNAAWLVRRSKGVPALRWANDLGRAIQASIVGYAAGGTFASLEMWDGFYIVVVFAASARLIVAKELKSGAPVPATATWWRQHWDTLRARAPAITSRV